MTGHENEKDPRTGILVAGKYRVLELLGQGGMGSVYAGVDEELGGRVAVKFLHRMFASDPSLRARFRREAQALSRLRHPGIVSLLHFGEHEDDIFMVMELVAGKSLAQVIADGPLSFPFVTKIFDELLEVLDVAHSAGVVHRDVKPSNVMVLPGDRIKLLDFGLVILPEVKEKLTMAGIATGTPDYMSPEQSEGQQAEAASDVYSAGILLYECIAGDGPFDGGSPAVLMAQHLFVEPPPMRTRGHEREVPAALESLVRRALAKKPHERPTAAAMRSELVSFLKGTDSATLAERGVEARQRDARLDREERALTGRPVSLEATPSSNAKVEVRVGDRARASALRSALGVSGIAAVLADPDAPLAGGIGAVVVSASDDDAAIASLAKTGTPVLVVDVEGTDATLKAIRAGANDIVAKGANDSRVAAQVARLLRRKR